MTTWAIIPVKRFNKGKSRLSKILSARELYLLNVQNYHNTFYRLQSARGIDRILTVSKDEIALNWALRQGGWILKEEPKSSLNLALMSALNFIQDTEPGKVVIVPTDLPLMEPSDLDEVLSLIGTEPNVVIVPDQHQTGTNLLCISDSNLLAPCFGQGSFQKHCQQVMDRGMNLVVYLNSRIQWDLDTPEDFINLKIKIPDEIAIAAFK